MRIRELCARTGYSQDTIRFYEKAGLLPVARPARTFKDYSEGHVLRLLHIKYAKAAGFTLAQIRDLLTQWVDGHLSATEKAAVLTEQLQKIEQALAELQLVRQYLQEKATAEGIVLVESVTGERP